MSKEISSALQNFIEAQNLQKELLRNRKLHIREAEEAARNAEKEHNAAVKEAEKSLISEQREYARPLQKLASARLYHDHVEDGKSSITLEEGMRIEVHSSGSVYTTNATKGKVGVSLGGATVGGLIAGPIGIVIGGKKNKVETKSVVHDTRNLFITLTTTTNEISIQCNPDAEKSARDFTSAILIAASNVSETTALHESRMRELEEALDRERSDTKSIERLNSILDELRSDTSAIDYAERNVQEARSAVPSADLNAYEHRGLFTKLFSR